MTLPKLGRVRFYRSRAIEGDIKNYTLSRRGKNWYVSIQVEMELQSEAQVNTKQSIRLDMGIRHFVTTSEGEHILPKNSCRCQEKQLVILQRRLSKKKRFSEKLEKSEGSGQ